MSFIPNITPEKADEIIASHTVEHVSPELCENPLLSVVVTTFRHAAFIRQCMEGILMQKTSFPFEIIVGEDGSEDGSYEILLDYQKQHPVKIRLFHSNPNMGQYTRSGKLNSRRNYRACRGIYQTMVEGDDYWTDPEKLERQVAILQARPDASCVCHDVEIIGNDRGELLLAAHGDREELTFEDLLTMEAPLATGSLVWRRDAKPLTPPWALNMPYGDRLKMLFLAHSGPIIRIPSVMGAYRRHAGGATAQASFYSFDTRVANWHGFRNQRRHFASRGDAYFAFMERFTLRLLLKHLKHEKLTLGRLTTALKLLALTGPREIATLIHEHRARIDWFENGQPTNRPTEDRARDRR